MSSEPALLSDLFEVNPKRGIAKGLEVPFVAMADVAEHGRIVNRWTRRAFKSGSRFQNGDTLVARITPCLENGKTAFVDFMDPGEVGHGSTEFIVLAARDPRAASLYGYYLAISPDFRDYAKSRMIGSSGRQRVSAEEVANYPLKYAPTLAEQRAIVEVLGALDDRIEWCQNYRRLLLEAVLALFRGAVAEARELSSVATVTAGQSPPGSTYNEAEDGLPFFQGSAQFGDLVPSVLKWCSEPSRVAEAGDILFSVRAPVGDMNFAHIRCCIGRGLAGIRSEFPAVLYAALKSASDEWSIHDASGTIFGSISGRDLRATKVPWPVDVEAVSYQLEPLMAAALAAEEEAQRLRQIRDSLLPRLVSGTLRIPDTEALLEPVG